MAALRFSNVAASVILAVLAIGCNNPIGNAVNAKASDTTPLGDGQSVFVATANNYGVFEYLNGATSWTQLDWSNWYTKNSNLYYQNNYPVVYDVCVSSGTVYAATSDGVIVGSGSSAARYLAGTKINGVTVSGTTVYASTDNGLKVDVTGTPSSVGSGIYGQLLILSSTSAFAATNSGVQYSSVSSTLAGIAISAKATSVINSLYYDSANTTLYAGTSLGMSYSASPSGSSTWTDVTASSLGGTVNGIVKSGSLILLATSGGLTFSADSGSSWTNIATTSAWNNLIAGRTYSNANTYYGGFGWGGLAIVIVDTTKAITRKSFSMDAALSGFNVSKVFVTVP